MKADSRVSFGMQHGHNTSCLWPHNMFINNRLIYLLRTKVVLCENKDVVLNIVRGHIFLSYFNKTNDKQFNLHPIKYQNLTETGCLEFVVDHNR